MEKYRKKEWEARMILCALEWNGFCKMTAGVLVFSNWMQVATISVQESICFKRSPGSGSIGGYFFGSIWFPILNDWVNNSPGLFNFIRPSKKRCIRCIWLFLKLWKRYDLAGCFAVYKASLQRIGRILSILEKQSMRTVISEQMLSGFSILRFLILGFLGIFKSVRKLCKITSE